MISRTALMTRKRRSAREATPGFHLSNLKLLCALLSRKERRSGGKAGEERAPPRRGDGGLEAAGVLVFRDA
jgi:hypothetical protein